MTLGDFDDIAFFTLPFLGQHTLGFFGQYNWLLAFGYK
jgi:hypothetical protein